MIITLRDNDAYSGSKYTFDTEAGKIGEGRHVNVYVAQFSSPKGVMPVIIKEPKFATTSENDRMQRQSEVVTDNYALPHILSVIPVQVSQNKIKKDLAIEYVRGITLTQFIDNNLKPKYEDEYVNVRSLHNKYLIKRDKIAYEIIKDIAKAIEDMHSLGVSHEELTADDILVTAEGSVRLSSTGQANPNGSFSDDIFRIGVIAYQLCSCNCDLGHVDINYVETAQMREFISNALSHNFDTISELCEALDKIHNFEITSGQKGFKGLFSSKRKTVFNIYAPDYGIYIPGITPLASSKALEADEDAKRKADEEAKRKAEEEAKRKAEEDAKRKAEEEEQQTSEPDGKKKLKIVVAYSVVALLAVIIMAISLRNNDDRQTTHASDNSTTVITPTEQKTEVHKATKQTRQDIESSVIEQQFKHQVVEGKAEVKTKYKAAESSDLAKHNRSKPQKKVKTSNSTKKVEKENIKEKKGNSSKPIDIENTETRENSQRALGL